MAVSFEAIAGDMMGARDISQFETVGFNSQKGFGSFGKKDLEAFLYQNTE